MIKSDPYVVNIESQIKIQKLIEKLYIFKLKFGTSFVDYYCAIQFGDGNGVSR